MARQGNNLGDADSIESLLSERLTEVSKRTWWTQLANRKYVSPNTSGQLCSGLSGTPLTLTTAPTPGNRVTFYCADKVDFVASSSPCCDEKIEVAHRESFAVGTGYFETSPVRYNINQQDQHAVKSLINCLADSVIATQDRIVQAAMLGICRGELGHRDNRGLADKVRSPFISHINDITKQCIKPVSRIFVTGEGAEGAAKIGRKNINFCEYEEPKNRSVRTSADNAINNLTDQAGDCLTLEMVRSIRTYARTCINRKEYPFKKAVGPDRVPINKYITVLVNPETMENLIEEACQNYPGYGIGRNSRLQNAGEGIFFSEFYLVPCDSLPIYENAKGNLVGVAAILGEGALVVLNNNGAQGETGIRVISHGEGRWAVQYPFGCMRPAFCRKNEEHPTDYGVMLIHHGMG